MLSTIKDFFRKSLNKYGYDFIPYRPAADPNVRRNKLIKNYQIDVIIDVGANIGQYGVELRAGGYEKEIISFEPVSFAFSELQKKAINDSKWYIYNFALGDKNEKSVIHVANNSLSSSIREMLPSHEKSAPEAVYVSEEEIELKTLDFIYSDLNIKNKSILLKIDTQGFEKNVLKGAKESLKDISTVQLEMSLTPLYKGETLFFDMIGYLGNIGYKLVHLEHVFSDKITGQLLQVDGIFHKS